MARPGPRRPATAAPQPPDPSPALPPGLFGASERDAALWGERLRKLAMGLTAALIAARCYWPGEDAETGSGLPWVLLVLSTLGIAIASMWLRREVALRLSVADIAMIVLAILIGISVSQAADRRAGITMAWEAVGGVSIFLLLRNLPRGRNELAAMAGSLVATAAALSALGFYQIGVEDPNTRALYLRDPARAMQLAGVGDDPGVRQRFEDRLLGSSEPRATFALTNSLAGVIVGPMVLGAAVAAGMVLAGRRRPGSIAVPLALAMAVLSAILACLVLTKSRSAYIGLVVGLGAVFWARRRGLRGRTLGLVAVAGLVLSGIIVAAGIASGQLDRQILTESTKSLGYRGEWWRSTWAMLNDGNGTFWTGVGPGNFAGPYLRYKLAVSSEEIKDPHNLLLETWASSGVLAMVALLLAIGFGIGAALRSSPTEQEAPSPGTDPPSTWLWWSAGLGGLLMVVAMGKLDPIVQPDDLMRWLVLASGWLLGALGLRMLWRRVAPDGPAAGGAALAVSVNLLAAGALGAPPVSLALWCPLALGLTVRDDRACGRLRPLGGRWVAFGLAAVWAAMIGAFLGGVLPSWRSGEALNRAAMALERRPPDFDAARQDVLEAAATDRYAAAPWVFLAEIEYRDWLASGGRPDANVGLKITTALDRAVSPPRDPGALRVHRLRMSLLRDLIARQAASLAPQDARALREDLANTAARAVVLNPTKALLHAELADAAAAINRMPDAIRHAREALRLDETTPHLDQKLPDALRDHLRTSLITWGGAGAGDDAAPPAPR